MTQEDASQMPPPPLPPSISFDNHSREDGGRHFFHKWEKFNNKPLTLQCKNMWLLPLCHQHDHAQNAVKNSWSISNNTGGREMRVWTSTRSRHQDHFRNNKQIQTLKIETDINKSVLKLLIVDVLHQIHDFGHASTTNLPATKTKIRIFIWIEWRSFL